MRDGTHKTIIKLLCKSDVTFQAVEAAVHSIAEDAPTKRARIVESFPSPSDYGKKPTCKDVLDHLGGSLSLHTSLQVEAFGNFMDIIMNEDEIDLECNQVATSLMQKMSNKHHNERARQKDFLSEVEKLFPKSYPTSPESSKSVSTDATITVELNDQVHHLLNYEFKHEMKNISSDPFHQNIAYFILLQHIRRQRSPMLLVNVVGCHYLQVFGAVWNGDHVCVDPLCPPVSLLFVPRDPICGAARMARVLAAIKSTLSKLVQYHRCPDEFNKGPYWHYKGLPYRQMSSIRWLFEADDGEQEIVVKFARSYGEDVHRFLADLGLAPQLLTCTRLAGGWYAVVMEKVIGLPLQYTVDRQVKESFQEAVRRMHEEGYVHGDLRPQNVLVFEGKVRILDFDWAGRCGVARYPKELNMSSGWHGDVQPGGHIDKDHDTYQLQQISVNED